MIPVHICGYDRQGLRLAMTVCGDNADNVTVTGRMVEVTCPRCCRALIQQLARQGGLGVTVETDADDGH